MISSLRFFFMTPQERALVAGLARREEEIIKLMCVLPGKYRYEQLDGALIRTGLSPRMLYEHASAGRYTEAMARLDAEPGLPVKEVSVTETDNFAEEIPTPHPTKKTNKIPYYHKSKGKWWK
jgi:hypothetical protein